MNNKTKCPDCYIDPGELHELGCDVETCPRCGLQQISCDCIYEVNGVDPSMLSREVYSNGPLPYMWKQWDVEWKNRRIPWAGQTHMSIAAKRFGWYVVWTENGWCPCSIDTPGAVGDVTRVLIYGHWDRSKGDWYV